MEDNMFTESSTREELYRKLRENFDGKIVRKDLTKRIKEGANVPVYVLEFLLGQYCNSDDEDVVQDGVEQVKRILSENHLTVDDDELKAYIKSEVAKLRIARGDEITE